MKQGDTVICINDKRWPKSVLKMVHSLPVKGHFYTVRRIIPNITNPDGPPGVALNEIKGFHFFIVTNKGDLVLEEYHFKIARFKEAPIPSFIQRQNKSWITNLFNLKANKK